MKWIWLPVVLASIVISSHVFAKDCNFYTLEAQINLDDRTAEILDAIRDTKPKQNKVIQVYDRTDEFQTDRVLVVTLDAFITPKDYKKWVSAYEKRVSLEMESDDRLPDAAMVQLGKKATAKVDPDVQKATGQVNRHPRSGANKWVFSVCTVSTCVLTVGSLALAIYGTFDWLLDDKPVEGFLKILTSLLTGKVATEQYSAARDAQFNPLEESVRAAEDGKNMGEQFMGVLNVIGKHGTVDTISTVVLYDDATEFTSLIGRENFAFQKFAR